MPYSKYQYVAKVAELQSISKAAAKLFISQPALTRIILNIETELGTTLFNRSVLPIQLTYAGKRYLEEARRIWEIDESFRRELQEISELKRGVLNIGINYAAGALWLPLILPEFHREYPAVTINLTQRSSMLFELDLLRGNIDLAFTTQTDASANLTYEYLSSARILAFIYRDHPILRGMNIDDNGVDNLLTLPPQLFDGQDFVLLHSADGFGHTVEKMMESLNIHPAHIMYVPDIVSCCRLAAAGMGITFATPYATHYTLPGAVPVIAGVSTSVAYEHNAIAFSKKKELNTIEKRFISLARAKISDSPSLQPLTGAQWQQLQDEKHGMNEGWI